LASSQVPDAIVFESNIQYGTGDGEKLTLNLARPRRGRPFPAVVFIHGGAWQGGNKELHDGQSRNWHSGIRRGDRRYRLAPKFIFPAQIEDCKCAVRWLRRMWPTIDRSQNVSAPSASSAGSHLAMMLGAMDSRRSRRLGRIERSIE